MNKKIMMNSMTEEFVKKSILKFLSHNGWGPNSQPGGLRGRGVDIKVRHERYWRYFLIECKGQGKSSNTKSNNAHKEVAFVYSLGQIITRMKSGSSAGYKYGLGLPGDSAKIALRRLPWKVAKELQMYVFSVTPDGKVAQHDWKDLKKRQESKK